MKIVIEGKAEKFEYLRLPADLERFVSKTRALKQKKIFTWWKKECKRKDGKARTDAYILSKTEELRESQKKFIQGN